MDFDIQEELASLSEDVSAYSIPNEVDISEDSSTIADVLHTAVDALADSPDNIADPRIFDAYRSLLKHASHLQGIHMTKILDSISSAYAAQIEAAHRNVDQDDSDMLAHHRKCLEMFAFLLQWFVLATEKVKSSGEDDAPAPAPKPRRGRGGKATAARSTRTKTNEEWSWMDQIPAMLTLIQRLLRLKTQRIWQTTAERENFISCVVRPIYHVLESEQYMKSKPINDGVVRAICLAVKHQGHGLAAQVGLMQSLQYYEHLPDIIAECLNALAQHFDHYQLGDEFLREVSGKSFSAQDNKGPRVFSRFLIRFAEIAPRQVLKQLSLLIKQLDSESYPMRMALVEVIGHIIRELAAEMEGEDAERKAQMLKQLTGLYELLLERVLDLSSYVRVKVFAVLARLCDCAAKFPQQRLLMTKAAVEALEDKTSSVRKSAMSLLIRLILTHPYGIYGGFLSENEWQAQYQEATDMLAKMEGEFGKAVEREEGEGSEDDDEDEEEDDDDDAEDAEEATGSKKRRKSKRKSDDDMDVDGEEGGDDDDDDDDDDVPMADASDDDAPRPKKRGKKKKPRKSQLNMEALTNEAAALGQINQDQHLEQKLKKKFCLDALQFIRELGEAIKAVQRLLASTNKLEVLEAMEFSRVAYEYKIEAADAGLKRMLHLIWHKDNNSTAEDGKEVKGIKLRLLECYRSMFFEPVLNLEPKQQVNRIAKNMIEYVSVAHPLLPIAESARCARLTYHATLAELTSLEEMMRQLMEEDRIHGDVVAKLWQVYSSSKGLPTRQRRGAVIVLSMLALAKREVVANHVEILMNVGLGDKGKNDLTLARYTCVALQRLNGSAKKVKGSLLDKTLRYPMENPLFSKLQVAMERPCRSKEWFPMAEQAINTVYNLAERPDLFCTKLIKNFTRRVFSKKGGGLAPSQSQNGNPDAMDEDEGGDPDKASQSEGGDTADTFELSQLLFIVGHVAIKQIVFLELVEREWKRQKHERELAEKIGGAAEKSKEQEELDQVAGNAEDEIGERVAGMREHELLHGPKSLLAKFGPMLNQLIRATATLSLSKFLCVSSQFCEEHHRLLFRVLEKSRDPGIRSNIVIALGDVAVAFSSIIDESNDELYKGLRDGDIVVKKNTLMVLTHLILNGMVKVKGQMGEMAKCVGDEDERISDLAKLFFQELSSKDNAIYNNLPDGERSIDEEAFQSTMKYIFTFVQKEKQAENIVDKLCQRFRTAEEPRHWRDIAYCLSLLQYKSERSVKKLTENLQFYRDKVHEETVYQLFQEIIAKARQNKSANKPDTELNEFETALLECRRQGAEDHDFEKGVAKRKRTAKKRQQRATQRTRKAPAKHVEDDEDDE
ncbi:non-SMC mitotic condensation complex subunit 1-domain-containing protein [Epithele typhae]|uniref:non-SMC mitotic condensation complex subunit 1-domain-containing protein n=1 Tax=Epithele typhae TaxID=378194 RepID=UPI0020085D88|nr:non-SMC mitotic condensation complex subunit 1-domain-containing protein [Epithele typhae]KAH9912294.1 non-SMC mitotic condensation complex subunit 1-domain-containing protein [Epithele typhae]